jgi:hypothetical protein
MKYFILMLKDRKNETLKKTTMWMEATSKAVTTFCKHTVYNGLFEKFANTLRSRYFYTRQHT